MEQWLTRTAKNWISGPYSKEQVCKMIMDGKLGLQDEVCPANGYWILLHERKEIFDQLGVEVPRSHGATDEVTESEITVGPKSSSGALDFSQANPHSTTFTTRSPSSMASNLSNDSSEDEGEKIKTHRGLSFILLGAGLLLIIALRAFNH